jgi:hypothetical protein
MTFACVTAVFGDTCRNNRGNLSLQIRFPAICFAVHQSNNAMSANVDHGMIIKGQWVSHPSEEQILEAERGGWGSEEMESAHADAEYDRKYDEEVGKYGHSLITLQILRSLDQNED